MLGDRLRTANRAASDAGIDVATGIAGRDELSELRCVLVERIPESALDSLIQSVVVVHGNQVGVAAADLMQDAAMRVHVERVDAVRAEERDALSGQHFVPHLLELDGGLEVVIPEQVHHLAEEANVQVPRRPDGLQNRQDGRQERRPLRQAVPHEAGETLLGVGDDELPAAHGLGNLDSGRVETIADHPDMSRRSDDDRSPAVPQAGSKKVGDGAAEKLLIGIELHDVIAGVWCAEQAFPRLRRTQRRGWRSHPDCEQPPTNL